jgi:hypothetical protein
MLTPGEIVQLFLRAQNLEQIREFDQAVELYEQAVAAGFDAIGPYDRLIAIYNGRDQIEDVKRIATAALANVRTFDAKKAWYESLRDAAPTDRPGAEF